MASSSCSMSLAIPDTLTQRPSPSLRSGPHMMNIAPVRRAALARTAAEMVSELPTVSMRIENLARAERLLGRWRGLVPRGRSGPHAREVRASNLARSSPGCRTPGLLVRRGRRFFGTLQFNNLDGPPHSTIRQQNDLANALRRSIESAANCRHAIGNVGWNKADVQRSILDATVHRASIGSCRHWRHRNRPCGCGQHDTRERNFP
jgi:hypothetical protein